MALNEYSWLFVKSSGALKAVIEKRVNRNRELEAVLWSWIMKVAAKP